MRKQNLWKIVRNNLYQKPNRSMKTTNCQRCGKEIERRWARKYCTQCRKIVDDERYKNHRKESKDDKIKKLSEEKEQLIKLINTAIGIAYDKDDEEAIQYLINEKNHYPDLFI